ncbi:MAG: glucose-6-phosphate isomerase [Acidaminococcaceae bacterium]|nr:glucose-6-phosphate isomerase [Acidaminococcaceae bacterium]HCJ90395.1 glucose-6-phosphate isomerase [Acidaminococcaceae bacterium]
MTFDGSVGLKDGLAFIYRNMMGRDGVTEKMLEDFLPVMADASVALQKIFETGFAKAHLSKDGTPEHVFFPRQAYLKEGNPNDEASLRRLEEMGEAWRNNVDAAVFIGIGGSYLGDKVLFDLAAKPYWNQLPKAARDGRPQIYFAGNNVDGVATAGLMAQLTCQARHVKRPLHIMLVPISKSGTTMEPLSGFSALLVYMQQHPELFRVDVTAVTGLDPESSLLYRLAQENGWPALSIPEGIGGRYCVLSNPGLLMGAVLGYDIRALLEGAREMAECCLHAAPDGNPALVNAALKYLASKKKGAHIEVFMGYGDQLQSLGAWYVQLLAESLGKRNNRAGEPVYYGRTPVVATGTTDMHSMTQQHQDGRRDKVIQFLEVEEPAVHLSVRNPFPDEKALDLYAGKKMDTLLKAALTANEMALTGDGRLNARYVLPALEPRYAGQLFMFLMFSVAYEGEMADVDAFDQPGVEAYKRIMKANLAK